MYLKSLWIEINKFISEQKKIQNQTMKNPLIIKRAGNANVNSILKHQNNLFEFFAASFWQTDRWLKKEMNNILYRLATFRITTFGGNSSSICQI